ncbi:hypothetical protein ACHAWF_004719 [Thalassiosira exigua]
MCDKGCIGVFMKDKAYVLLNGRVILEVPRRANGLWYIQPHSQPQPQPQPNPIPADAIQCNAIANVYQIWRLKEAMQFLHAALGSPAKSTMLRAARQGILPPWPLLTAQNIHKHLVETMTTAKGHLQRVRKNVRSQAPLRAGIMRISMSFKKPRQMQSGGNRYIFLLYTYDGYAILMECMKTRADTEMKRVYKKSYARLEKRGIKPEFKVMDNEASNMICEWMEKNNIAYQKVPPDNHRANITERCIETGKHHIISILAGTDNAFLINQWDHLIPQAEWTLNMLRPCRLNPKLSAKTYTEGHHDYNHVPFVLLGWRTLVFEDPDRRASWAYHGIEGFAVGPAPEHYRCTTCWIPTTGADQISDTSMIFPPTHMTLPSLPTPEETVNEAARELGRVLQQMATDNPVYAHLGTYAGLKQLSDIVHPATTRTKAQRVEQEELQRVSTEQNSPARACPNAHVIPFDDDEVAPPQRVPPEDEPRLAPRPARQLRDTLYNKPILPSTHRYPTRHKALNILLQQHNIQPPPSSPPPCQPNAIQHPRLLHQRHLG